MALEPSRWAAALGWLWPASAVAMAAWMLVPHPVSADGLFVIGFGVLAAGAAAGLLVLWRRLRTGWTLHALTALATVAISVGMVAAGGPASGLGFFYLWALAHAACFLPARGLAFQVGFAVVAAAVASALSGGEPVSGRYWAGFAVLGTATLAVIAGLVRSLRTALAEQTNLMRRRSQYDRLTGLANRALLFEELDAHAAAPVVVPLACVVLDLDGFKSINDSLGHRTGDRVLQVVARRLAREARDGDLVVRMSGDEFVVLLPRTASQEAAGTVAQRFVAACERPMNIDGIDLAVGACAGVAIAETRSQIDDVVHRADLAMYEGKRRGSGHVGVFDASLRASADARVVMESELRRAVERDQLRLVYQPVVDQSDRSIAGVEALARWRHPELGDVPPDRFIELAERTGIIHGIGSWIVRAAIAQAAEWHAQGLTGIRVAINVSARQLADDRLVREVAAALRETGLPHGSIAFELTETALGEVRPGFVERLHALRRLGTLLVLDDFGTGYSSLMRLRTLPLDAVKVDRAFVSGIADSAPDRAIVEATVALAAALDMVVVAEGVETPAQEALLRELGCPLAQGYLYAAPVESGEVPGLIARQGMSTMPLPDGHATGGSAMPMPDGHATGGSATPMPDGHATGGSATPMPEPPHAPPPFAKT